MDASGRSPLVQGKKVLRFLQSLFRKEPAAAPPALASAAKIPEASAQPGVRWLAKDDPQNPFAADGYDCLGFVSTMLSTTKDQGVAATFVALRSSLGRDHIGKTPAAAIEAECHLEYPFDGTVADGALFKSRQMEEKWDIYLHADRIYFARSWTGGLAYVARFHTRSGALVIDRLWMAQELAAHDPQFPLRQVDYLVKSHVLKQRCPHPLPAGLARDAQTVGLFSFSQFGRLCCFGTYEETLRDDLGKPSQE